MDDSKSQHEIRIAGIDAPEQNQAFGERSRQSLAQMAHGRAGSSFSDAIPLRLYPSLRLASLAYVKQWLI